MTYRIGVTLLSASICLTAQSPAKLVALHGHIVDQAGAVIPRARIFTHVANEDAVLYAATSDRQGNFTLILPPGGYDILVTSPGFEASVQSVAVSAGKTASTRWKLKPHACEFPTMNCDTFQ